MNNQRRKGSKGIFPKVDAVRTGLNNVIKDYEMTTLGT